MVHFAQLYVRAVPVVGLVVLQRVWARICRRLVVVFSYTFSRVSSFSPLPSPEPDSDSYSDLGSSAGSLPLYIFSPVLLSELSFSVSVSRVLRDLI